MTFSGKEVVIRPATPIYAPLRIRVKEREGFGGTDRAAYRGHAFACLHPRQLVVLSNAKDPSYPNGYETDPLRAVWA